MHGFKWACATVGAAALLSVAVPCHAARLTPSIGAKLWVADWTTWFPPDTVAPTLGTNDTVISVSSGAEVIAIPSLTVRYDNFYVSGSRFASPDYGFEPYTDLGIRGGSLVEVTTRVTAKRQETEISVGYAIGGKLSVNLGYKDIQQDFTVRSIAGGVAEPSFPISLQYNGPYLGVAGGAAVVGGLGAYANMAYGLLKEDGGSDATYITSEVGFTYVLAPMWRVSAGYKYQTLTIDFGGPPANASTQNASDTAQGVSLAVTLTL